jgi:F0F1-type ATP synthase membrane subunit b/b'
MSNYPPDEPVYPATPIYDEAIATTPVEPVGSGSAGSGAADQAKQTAGQAAGTVKQTAGDVKDQAAGVASTANDAGAQVASTTKDEAQRVVADTMGQARQLYGQATSELSSQASKQQGRLTETIRTFGQDLAKMGSGEKVDSGPASELIQNLAGRAHGVAEWLESRSPEEVLHEVRRFAARRPGVFIGIAAATGVVAARVTKALTANAASSAGSALTGGSGDSGYVGGAGSTYVVPEPAGAEYTTDGQYVGAGYVAESQYVAEGGYVAGGEYGTEVAPENEYGTGTEPGTTGGLR